MTNSPTRGRADLHVHTKFSDGTDSHADIAELARQAELVAVAFTDHDTTAGYAAAAAVAGPDLAVLTGAEFSTHVSYQGRRVAVHLLGYLFDPTDAAIATEQQRVRSDRLRRGVQMTENLVAEGLPISVDQVLEIADGAPVGRPHIARALAHAGAVESVGQAFATVLSSRGPYFVAKQDTELETALGMIVAAGGVAVLAHPRGRGEARVLTADYLSHLVGLGLSGLEVDHPDHDQAARAELAILAADCGLLALGSSDYHGANKVTRLACCTTSRQTLEALVVRADGRMPVMGGSW